MLTTLSRLSPLCIVSILLHFNIWSRFAYGQQLPFTFMEGVDGELRLQGGDGDCQGRLEVFDNVTREWYQVCNDNFTTENAHTACRRILGCNETAANVTDIDNYGGPSSRLTCWPGDNPPCRCFVTSDEDDFVGLQCTDSGSAFSCQGSMFTAILILVMGLMPMLCSQFVTT